LDALLLHPVETTEGIETTFSGPFEKKIIDQAGHFVHLERSKVVNEAILTFLKNIRFSSKGLQEVFS
jgi:pimeloyl-ACP methyl ester carboxylesterase